MEKVLEFLKSLVIPQKMAKYRYMSVLISLIIFFAFLNLLTIPLNNYYVESQPEIKAVYRYQALQEIESNLADNETNEAVLQELSALECSVAEGILDCGKLEDNTKFNKEIIINVDGITKKIMFQVDLTEELPDFEKLKFDLEDYPYVDNEEVYLVLFLRTELYFQANQAGIDEKEIKHNNNQLIYFSDHYQYQSTMPELTLVRDEASARSLGNEIALELVNSYIIYASSFQTTVMVVMLFTFTLIITFMFWIVFKRTGKLKTFKEYYNIAAISSIVPFILAFILAWFWVDVLNKFIFVYIIFYLFVLFKINNSPDDVV